MSTVSTQGPTEFQAKTDRAAQVNPDLPTPSLPKASRVWPSHGKTARPLLPVKQRWGKGVGYQERETFDAFLKLPAPQRKIIREVIQAFAKAQGLAGN